MVTPPTLSGHLIVRTEGDPRPVLSALRHVIQAASSDFEPSRIQTLRQVVNQSLGDQRFTLVGGFAITVLLLASVGGLLSRQRLVILPRKHPTSPTARAVGSALGATSWLGDFIHFGKIMGAAHATLEDRPSLEPEEGSLDHVVPRSRGGKNAWENLMS